MNSRVRIGTCAGPADAVLVRSVFEAHGIQVLINSENHAGMLGGLGGAFVSLDIFVTKADAEEAVALLRDIREGDHKASDDDDAPDPGEPADDEAAHDAGVWTSQPEPRAADLPGAASFAQHSDRRRRTGVVLLLSGCVGLGTAHMYTRAWLRGLVLGCVQIICAVYLYRGGAATRNAIVLSCAARLGDAAGALWRVWSS